MDYMFIRPDVYVLPGKESFIRAPTERRLAFRIEFDATYTAFHLSRAKIKLFAFYGCPEINVR